ncbi:MAG: dTDP-4-dehydrorhamnose 3,5-epimerase [Hyphomicrobiales bacterium]
MQVRHTSLEGLLVIVPDRYADKRGFFSESWSKRKLFDNDIQIDFVQDNHSLTTNSGSIRGLHMQAPPHAQDKLVRCGRGRILDVAVDIREGSPTFGKWHSEELTFENGKQLLVPKGFLHGFSTLEDDSEVIYKQSDYYEPDLEYIVRFDDPDIGIDWQIDTAKTITSEKDAKAPFLKDIQNPFTKDWQAI